jgi:hypothetical protein
MTSLPASAELGPGDEPALPSFVKNVVDGLSTLVAGHVELARERPVARGVG